MKIKKQNEPLSSLTHLIGLFLAITALVLLIVFAVKKGTALHVVAYTIFGSSMVLLYLASTCYHFVDVQGKWKNILRKIDHAMIYILIAGTYTPIALVALRGGWGWSIFGVVWGLALAGIILKISKLDFHGWKSVFLYIGMGWLAIIAFIPLLQNIPIVGLFWLVLGGVLYTFGTIFFGLDKIIKRSRWFGMHEIFHLFVMAGSFCHFWLMLKIVVYL